MKSLQLFIIFLLSSILLFSCASNKERKRHENFLIEVKNQKAVLTPAQYQLYLKRKIDVKEGELTALKQLMDESNKRMEHHEVMQSNSAEMDPHSFHRVTTGIDLKNIDNRIKNVRKELLLLRSQLQ